MGFSNPNVKKQYALSAPFPTDFVIDFPYWNKDEIYVVLTKAAGDDPPLTLDTDYSLTDPDGLSGAASRITAWTDALRVTFFRKVERTQEIDPENGDAIDANTIEGALDKLTAIVAELDEKATRSLVLPITDTGEAGELPVAEERANKFLSFDADGKPIAVASGAGGYPVTPQAATLLDDTTLLEMQKTLEIVPAASVVGVSEQAKAFMETGSSSRVSHDGSAYGFGSTFSKNVFDWLLAQQKAKVEAAGWTWDPTDPLLLAKAERTVAFPLGTNLDIAGKHTVDWKFPAVLVSDADHVLDEANYPLYVPWLRAQLAEVWDGSSMVTEFSVSITSGVATGSGTAWDTLLAAIIEEAAVHGSYSGFRGLTEKASDITYAITNASLGTHTCNLSSPPADGSYTVQFHPHRIPGSTSTARTYKDQGRSVFSQDGVTYIIGLRRRDHLSYHWHDVMTDTNGMVVGRSNADAGSTRLGGQTGGALNSPAYATNLVTAPGHDTVKGGEKTESASSIYNRYQWVGIVL